MAVRFTRHGDVIKMMDIEQYIEKKRERAKKLGSVVKNYDVFSTDYVPKRPFVRAEAKKIIDALVHYQQTGIPRHMMVIGARGSGKTMSVKYLSRVFSQRYGLPFRYVNCRFDNSSFKILARILHIRPRGYSYAELCERFERQITDQCVIVLDEADLVSHEKDPRMDVLYFLSRSPVKPAVVLLSNNPRFVRTLDESTRSSLQPELLCFKSYSPGEINQILRDRAAVGLQMAEKALLGEISALTARNTNSDIRVALKTLLYCAIKESPSAAESFDRARQDVVLDMLRNLNDKALLILQSVLQDSTHLVKTAYEHYKNLSRTMGDEPYSYVYFYNTLSYLQSVGLITLVSAKVNRAYTNRIDPLFSKQELETVLETRFQ